jgi:hypothetical protein
MTNEATARAAETPPGADHADRLAALRADHPEVLRLTCARHIVTVLAGISADHEAGYGDWTSSFDDLAQADRLAEIAAGRGGRDRLVGTCKAIARLAVHDAWPLIVELADLLSDERRLPGPFVETWLQIRSEAVSLRSYYSTAFASPVESAAA